MAEIIKKGDEVGRILVQVTLKYTLYRDFQLNCQLKLCNVRQ